MAPPVVRFTHLSLPGREVGFLMFSSGVFILVLYYVFGPLFRSLINDFFNKDLPICTLEGAVLVLRVSVVFCGAVLFIDFVHVIFTRMVLCFLFRF